MSVLEASEVPGVSVTSTLIELKALVRRSRGGGQGAAVSWTGLALSPCSSSSQSCLRGLLFEWSEFKSQYCIKYDCRPELNPNQDNGPRPKVPEQKVIKGKVHYVHRQFHYDDVYCVMVKWRKSGFTWVIQGPAKFIRILPEVVEFSCDSRRLMVCCQRRPCRSQEPPGCQRRPPSSDKHLSLMLPLWPHWANYHQIL